MTLIVLVLLILGIVLLGVGLLYGTGGRRGARSPLTVAGGALLVIALILYLVHAR